VNTQGQTSFIYLLLEALHRMGNRSCDDVLREVFHEGKMSQSVRSVAAQLIFFTSLLDSQGFNTPKDVAIVKRLV